MAKTPKRAGRTAAEGSKFLSEIAAQNVRFYRAIRGLTQEDLAAVMARLGHGWVRATVSEVERNGRSVTVDELAGLAIALRVSVVAILDPRGPLQQTRGPAIDAGGDIPIPVPFTYSFVADLNLDETQAAHNASNAGVWSMLSERPSMSLRPILSHQPEEGEQTE